MQAPEVGLYLTPRSTPPGYLKDQLFALTKRPGSLSPQLLSQLISLWVPPLQPLFLPSLNLEHSLAADLTCLSGPPAMVCHCAHQKQS